MKRTRYILTSILILLATACEEIGSGFVDKIVGDWHYTATENGITEDIWLTFAADGTFEMYQKIGEGPYWYSTGEYTADPETKTLSGVYSDRYPWKYSYKVDVDSDSMLLTAVGIEGYSTVYVREAVPAEVRDMSLPLTKAEPVEAPRFL